MIAAPVPSPAFVFRSIAAAHGSSARCIRPRNDVYVCTATYLGRCTEFEAQWNGSKFIVNILARVNKPCAPISQKPTTPTA